MSIIQRKTSIENGQIHKATCLDCEKKCKVPFKPTGSKPVKCQECFSAPRN